MSLEPLDDLYGEGTTDRLWEVLPPVLENLEEVVVPEGVRVNVRWANHAQMKIECDEEEWRFLTFYTPDPGEGLYSACVDALEVVTRDLGIQRWRAHGADEESTKVLMKRGGWRRRGTSLVWTL